MPIVNGWAFELPQPATSTDTTHPIVTATALARIARNPDAPVADRDRLGARITAHPDPALAHGDTGEPLTVVRRAELGGERNRHLRSGRHVAAVDAELVHVRTARDPNAVGAARQAAGELGDTARVTAADC